MNLSPGMFPPPPIVLCSLPPSNFIVPFLHKKVLSEHVNVAAFSKRHTTRRAARSNRPDPVPTVCQHWAWMICPYGTMNCATAWRRCCFDTFAQFCSSSSGLRFSWRGATIKSSQTEMSETRAAVTRLPDSGTDVSLVDYCEENVELPTGNWQRAEAPTSAGCRLRQQASAATTELRSRWDLELNGDGGDRAGGSPQPRVEHAQDRVLRFRLFFLAKRDTS